jgi:hypothetical protein
MWDRKRQIIWLVAGLVFGTFFLYPLAREESGQVDWRYFLQLESLLILVIVIMLFFYSRKSG